MSARVPEPCDGVTGEHTGPVRFYRTGWQCAAHAPKPQPREAATEERGAAAAPTAAHHRETN